jgi:hypothetical protein
VLPPEYRHDDRYGQRSARAADVQGGRTVHRAGRAPGATAASMKLLAFSINSLELGDSVLHLFQELQASMTGTVKK